MEIAIKQGKHSEAKLTDAGIALLGWDEWRGSANEVKCFAEDMA